MIDIYIFIWGLAGVSIRYFLSTKIKSSWITTFINLISIIIISLVIKYDLGVHLLAFNSAFSTLSTYNYELINNYKNNKRESIKYFLINIIGSILIFTLLINL